MCGKRTNGSASSVGRAVPRGISLRGIIRVRPNSSVHSTRGSDYGAKEGVCQQILIGERKRRERTGPATGTVELSSSSEDSEPEERASKSTRRLLICASVRPADLPFLSFRFHFLVSSCSALSSVKERGPT